MTSYTAPQILVTLNLNYSTTIQENLINDAIDMLNLYAPPTATEISNLSGTAGSKTVTLTSKQKAAVLYVARVLYSSYIQNTSGNTSRSIANISLSQTDMLSNATVLAAIKDAAANLSPAETSAELPIFIGSDDGY